MEGIAPARAAAETARAIRERRSSLGNDPGASQQGAGAAAAGGQ